MRLAWSLQNRGLISMVWNVPVPSLSKPKAMRHALKLVGCARTWISKGVVLGDGHRSESIWVSHHFEQADNMYPSDGRPLT